MAGYDKILVPLDFSDCSQDLIDEVAKRFEAPGQVILIHVADLPNGLSSGARIATGSGTEETAEAHLARRSLERLRAYGEQLTRRGYHVEVVVGVGDTAEVIIEQAAARGAQLILMGTHGRRGLPRVVTGSIASDVVSQATCPVMTVRTLHRSRCAAQSCDRCEGHLTDELRLLIAEQDG